MKKNLCEDIFRKFGRTVDRLTRHKTLFLSYLCIVRSSSSGLKFGRWLVNALAADKISIGVLAVHYIGMSDLGHVIVLLRLYHKVFFKVQILLLEHFQSCRLVKLCRIFKWDIKWAPSNNQRDQSLLKHLFTFRCENLDIFVLVISSNVRIFGSKCIGPCRKVPATFRKMFGFSAPHCSWVES